MIKLLKVLIRYMNNVLEELERVQKLFNSLPGDEDHRGNKYKSDREWWVLGNLKKIFDGEYIEFPDYATKLPEHNTDFSTSFDGKTVFKQIQITEIPPLENLSKGTSTVKIDIWAKYEEILKKKLKAKFGSNNWLVVYFDIRYSQITSIGTWHNTLLRMSKKINFPKHHFEKIIVMDPRGSAAISIFPYFFIICPEWMPGSTIIDEMIVNKNTYYNALKKFATDFTKLSHKIN
ncbi:MAG: hypothetical protein WAU11_15420 [Ignavibacteriaceae bacterium]